MVMVDRTTDNGDLSGLSMASVRLQRVRYWIPQVGTQKLYCRYRAEELDSEVECRLCDEEVNQVVVFVSVADTSCMRLLIKHFTSLQFYITDRLWRVKGRNDRWSFAVDSWRNQPC